MHTEMNRVASVVRSLLMLAALSMPAPAEEAAQLQSDLPLTFHDLSEAASDKNIQQKEVVSLKASASHTEEKAPSETTARMWDDNQAGACDCQNWKNAYISRKATCGMGPEFYMFTHDDHPSEDQYNDVRVQKDAKELCTSFFERMDHDLCVNVNKGEDKGQWCYVSSDCSDINGGSMAKFNDKFGWKRCRRDQDGMLRKKIPEYLEMLAERDDVDLGLLHKMSYPLDQGRIPYLGMSRTEPLWSDRRDLWIIRHHRSQTKMNILEKMLDLGKTLLQTRVARIDHFLVTGKPHSFDTRADGKPPHRIMLGANVYAVVQSDPSEGRGSKNKLLCLPKEVLWEKGEHVQLEDFGKCPTHVFDRSYGQVKEWLGKASADLAENSSDTTQAISSAANHTEAHSMPTTPELNSSSPRGTPRGGGHQGSDQFIASGWHAPLVIGPSNATRMPQTKSSPPMHSDGGSSMRSSANTVHSLMPSEGKRFSVASQPHNATAMHSMNRTDDGPGEHTRLMPHNQQMSVNAMPTTHSSAHLTGGNTYAPTHDIVTIMPTDKHYNPSQPHEKNVMPNSTASPSARNSFARNPTAHSSGRQHEDFGTGSRNQSTTLVAAASSSPQSRAYTEGGLDRGHAGKRVQQDQKDLRDVEHPAKVLEDTGIFEAKPLAKELEEEKEHSVDLQKNRRQVEAEKKLEEYKKALAHEKEEVRRLQEEANKLQRDVDNSQDIRLEQDWKTKTLPTSSADTEPVEAAAEADSAAASQEAAAALIRLAKANRALGESTEALQKAHMLFEASPSPSNEHFEIGLHEESSKVKNGR
eukprot:gnl/TRDRNA2_/TRDRNA2_125032_c0_seq1.p1 gnl/TRDRNA2_/TRDRNA2_125032_c0~~gnl/TRDRNA2_/TRDRNA2_125032_c0_seq1.p1  ORF type:complete len:808 (-),score=136.06 gnl/TRDRNA2_/TRDRNA2_125032_c0_seq1:115-2538(-)